MGKNLKGKELGTGLSQRADGRYMARFQSRSGKRVTKYFTNHEYVFLNSKGKPTHKKIYDRTLNRIAEKMGIETFSMHSLRHSFATRCIEAGMKPKTLQKILGHSKISMTMDLYVHVTEDEAAKEMGKFEDLFSGIKAV